MKNMKRTKMDPESSPFKIMREIVIVLQSKYDRQELTSTQIKCVKARLDRARSGLQEDCLHEKVAELMLSRSPRKTPNAKVTFSGGRVCLDCGLKELASEMKGHFYRILPGPSFFANFSDIEKLKNLLDNPTESKLVFRKLDDLLEENSQKEGVKVKS